MKNPIDLGYIILIVAVVIGLGANHAGWNPWFVGLGSFVVMSGAMLALLIWLKDQN